MATALLFGVSLLSLLQSYPGFMLGVLLAISGLETASAARDNLGRKEAVMVLATGTVGCLVLNSGWGFLLALAVEGIYRVQKYISISFSNGHDHDVTGKDSEHDSNQSSML